MSGRELRSSNPAKKIVLQANKILRHGLLLLLLIPQVSNATSTAPTYVVQPAVAEEGQNPVVEFTLSEFTDVEVSILDSRGKVVRHLAAGVLGANAPAPFTKNSLRQSIIWDGKDDHQQILSPLENYRLRIRAGMDVRLESILGGDPYAFFSREMGQGDHAAWAITGLEAKPDGNVYVIGNANNFGPAALRAFSSTGNFKHTVYPPPAGKSIEQMESWGIEPQQNSTYHFTYNDLDTPSPGTTLITGNRAFVAGIVPTVNLRQLVLLGSNLQTLTVNTDGTIPRNQGHENLVESPPKVLKRAKKSTSLPIFSTPSFDGQYIYLTGPDEAIGPRISSDPYSSAWREGRVYKVDKETGATETFFSLEETTLISDLKARSSSPIRDSRTTRYGAFHGVAVDKQNRVFICDRLNQRILVLDQHAAVVRQIPVNYPDAIAVDTDSTALYVTTRYGDFHNHGELRLLKFNDWTKDSRPSTDILLHNDVGMYTQQSFLTIAHTKNRTYIWVAYTELPVRIYTTEGSDLKLVKDFQTTAWQQVLDLQHMTVDKRDDTVFIHDGWGNCFRVASWSDPGFAKCKITQPEAATNAINKKQLRNSKRARHKTGVALGFAIDPTNNLYYLRPPLSGVMRYVGDGMNIRPDEKAVNQTDSTVTPPISNAWAIHMGHAERGMAVGPDGGLAVLGSTEKNQYAGPLTYYQAASNGQYTPVAFTEFGKAPRSAGVRFDLAGNLYAGKVAEPEKASKKKGQESTLNLSTGKIYKYKPTGSLESGNLFPVPPEKPEKVYNVNFGAIGTKFPRVSFFDVDEYGRIYYPSSLQSRVSIMDNEGNQILQFGSWGNRDSMGSLSSDATGNEDIPLAYPSSVGTTDNYVYVSDLVNIRLLRIKKSFALETTVPIPH